jgi:hypothetical protein
MKKILISLSIVSLVILMTACSKEMAECNCPASLPAKFDEIVVEPSMKGWELYSWPEDKKGCRKWNYVLLPGTDRLKSYSEVTNDALLHVTGEQQLKLLLNKFPTNEHILWVGETWLSNVWGRSSLYYGSLKLPPTALQNEVLQHCLQRGLELMIAP